MRAALLQMTSGDDPGANIAQLSGLAQEAVAEGADLLLSPEVSNCVSNSRSHQREVLRPEAEDPMLAEMRDFAAQHGVWMLLGSIGVLTEDPDGRFANAIRKQRHRRRRSSGCIRRLPGDNRIRFFHVGPGGRADERGLRGQLSPCRGRRL